MKKPIPSPIPEIRMREHWWQFWRPRYAWMQTKVNDSLRSYTNVALTPKGRVVKATARKEFDPFERRTRGRVVRTMPRQLKKIKEGQDAVPKVPSED